MGSLEPGQWPGFCRRDWERDRGTRFETGGWPCRIQPTNAFAAWILHGHRHRAFARCPVSSPSPNSWTARAASEPPPLREAISSISGSKFFQPLMYTNRVTGARTMAGLGEKGLGEGPGHPF